MQAIILAAGMGKRLKELTQNNTKCMVKVNGVSLIDRLLHQLEKQHLSRIVIVVGYEGQKLIDYIATLGIKTPISYVDNAVYDKTNNIYSLALAKNYLMEEDTLLFESDVIIEDSAIDELVRHGVNSDNIDVVKVPGAFEIPVIALKCAKSGKYNAVITLGAVIKGSTPHFDFVSAEVSKGVAQVSLQTGIPVIFGVLTTDNIEQAIERAGTKAGNKGSDAAKTAIEMANLVKLV